MVNKILFIEGTKDDTNGDLREGFSKLLSQKLSGNMPRIKMGNNLKSTTRVFLNNKLSKIEYLLIDLDEKKSEKKNKLREHCLYQQKDKVFFMIQEMESWFLSQPEILDKFYGEILSKKINSETYQEIEKPAKFLQKITINSKKRKYHKVKHGVELLKRLDANKLENSSSEFKNLITILRKL
ncbi:MAG: DUF4276 family protein [Candidatus Cloacimonetes bacterium]|nr:DUF4276 family protein [Candidatus Cloacimonadota bacterium]